MRRQCAARIALDPPATGMAPMDSRKPFPPPRALPRVHGVTAHSEGDRRVEEVDLEFGNGERRRYRRVCARGPGSVMVAAMADAQTILLIREYACGTGRYEIGLPKGRMDEGETPEQAANRELQEETGFAARRLTRLRSLALSPSYMEFTTHLVLAQDLYPQRLVGDEPEEIEVLPWKLEDLHALMLREDCSEGRSLAALFIVRELLARGGMDVPA